MAWSQFDGPLFDIAGANQRVKEFSIFERLLFWVKAVRDGESIRAGQRSIVRQCGFIALVYDTEGNMIGLP